MEYLHKDHGDTDPQDGVEPVPASLIPNQSSPLPQDHVEATQENVESPDEVEVVEEVVSSQDAEVLAELGRLQNQQPPWWRAIGILAVSLVLFVGATQSEQSGPGWQSVVILIAVLAFHELGHYIVMRCFGYRNLRMFFIPFFGAAVSGRNYNVAGWKKAAVALAGPVPGILIGVPIGLVGVFLREPRVVEVALLLLILNGFNLLPFLPLDGGWVVHAVLFVRHPALDVVFRLVAALCLLGVSLLLGAWILAGLAVFMLLALPLAWRLASVAYRLKQQGYVAVSSDADTIPAPAALSILAELRPALPPQTTPRILAQNVASVFETLNAEPPSLVPSFCILAVHACSFLLVLAMSAAIIITTLLQRHA